MSFEARIALNGKYHEADDEVISDPRNWPRLKQQDPKEVATSINEELSISIDESDDNAENQTI